MYFMIFYIFLHKEIKIYHVNMNKIYFPAKTGRIRIKH